MAASVRSDGRPPDGPGWPVRLHTLVWNPDGPAGNALLLHGLGSDAATLWRIASHLADRGMRVEAPDLRGHGSSPPAQDLRITTMTADIALLGSRWDVLVGHSLGGAIAAQLLARDDVTVTAALLIDPVLALGGPVRDRVHAEVRADVGVLERSTVTGENPRWDPEDVDRKVLAAARCTPGVVDRVFAHNPDWEFPDLHERWRARVHVLGADPEIGSMLDLEVVERIAAAPDVTYAPADGAGHSVHRDDPDTVLAALDALRDGTH